MNKFYYSTDGTNFYPVGELKKVFISEPTQEAEYPDIRLQNETVSISFTLRKKDKKAWGSILQMPKYKVTEWMFPKKKKRGSIRRKKHRKGE